MKAHYSGERGFGIVGVIAIVAVLALGGTAYYAAKETNEEGRSASEGSANLNATSSAKSELNSEKGSLRNLVSIGRNVMCTVDGSESAGNTSGTVYIDANANMRGDFVTESQNGGVIESHMIKSGETVYAWSGNQGGKMNISNSMNANANANATGTVDMDREVNYRCVEWQRDQAKFNVPNNINFVDVDAMLNGSVEGSLNNQIRGVINQ